MDWAGGEAVPLSGEDSIFVTHLDSEAVVVGGANIAVFPEIKGCDSSDWLAVVVVVVVTTARLDAGMLATRLRPAFVDEGVTMELVVVVGASVRARRE